MSINCIFSIIKDICFFAAIIMLVILIAEVHKSNKNTKDGSGTIEQQQKNGHYKIAMHQIPRNLLIEVITIIIIALLLKIIGFKPIMNFLETNSIKLKASIILVCVFIIFNSILFIYQTRDAKRLLYYDEFYEHYRIVSTNESKKRYNYEAIYNVLNKNKRRLEYLADCANKDYDKMKFLSPIPIISFVIDIIVKCFDITIINSNILTAVVGIIIFLYISMIFIINRKLKRIKYNILRNDECRDKIKSMQEKDSPKDEE